MSIRTAPRKRALMGSTILGLCVVGSVGLGLHSANATTATQATTAIVATSATTAKTAFSPATTVASFTTTDPRKAIQACLARVHVIVPLNDIAVSSTKHLTMFKIPARYLPHRHPFVFTCHR